MNLKEADRSDTLTYNSNREDLIIPEYGRGISTMVKHMMSLADKAERTKCAEAIVSIMKSVVPQEGSEEEAQHKLWNQLHQMSGYQMDVDSPFEKPQEETRDEAPDRLDYPKETSRAGHFGRITPAMIEKAKAMEESDEKAILIVKIANTMKMNFLTWNTKTVEREFVAVQLKELSGGALILPEDAELESTAEILRNMRKTSDALERKRGGNKNNNKGPNRPNNKGGRPQNRRR